MLETRSHYIYLQERSDRANFRPITLQPVLYKIYASIIRDRFYKYLERNKYIDRSVQKEFWPGIEGVAEHSQLFTHITKNAKRHQRTLIVSLIDLHNAFREVHLKLIHRALLYRHVPVNLQRIIGDIYTDTYVKVAHRNETTPDILVMRRVLQGDPCFCCYSLCISIY